MNTKNVKKEDLKKVTGGKNHHGEEACPSCGSMNTTTSRMTGICHDCKYEWFRNQ